MRRHPIQAGIPLALGHLVGAALLATCLTVGRVGIQQWNAAASVALGVSALIISLIPLLPGGVILQRHWQVPADWRYTLEPVVMAISYGFLLGTGIVTYVVTPAMWTFVLLGPLVQPAWLWTAWLIFAGVRFIRLLSVQRHTEIDGESVLFSGSSLRIGSALLTVTAVAAVTTSLG